MADRIIDAIKGLAYRINNNGNVTTNQVFKALKSIELSEEESIGSVGRSYDYEINILIGFIQEKARDKWEEIAELEKKFIHFLEPNGIISPKYIFYKMASSPEYVRNLCNGILNL